MKNCLGIELGNYRIKIAYMEKNVLAEYFSERIENGEKPDHRLIAQTVRELLTEKNVRCKKAVFVLKQEDSYVKRVHMPLMTVDQLKLNLPYEFHDYTGDRSADYRYDYALIDRDEKEMDLLAAACRKDLCEEIAEIAKLAKLKIVGIVPAAVGLERILERAEGGEKDREKKDFAVLDLRNRAVMIHFFRKGIYDMTRNMEPGCSEIELLVGKNKEKLTEFGLDADESLWEEQEKNRYQGLLDERLQSIAVQVMRVMNFYSFNNADNTIDALYYCGSGAKYEPLLRTVSENVGIPLKSLAELAPEVDHERMPEWMDSPQTYGVLLD